MYLVRPPYLLKKIYSKAIWRMDKTHKKIYLTFDDGPVQAVTPWVLDVLKQYNIKATFFCVGENVVKYPKIYQRILDENHTIGNHTYNHLNGWNTQTKQYIDNIELCQQALHLGNSKEQSNLFRPPYGRAKKSQISHLSNNNIAGKPSYSIIMWDVLSGDYDKKTNPEKCLSNVINNVRNGSIIVFHDNIKAQKNLEYALPRFIEYAKVQEFEFEKLD
jgi:peptidoglycan/xylan/chitin deacetylase (PgdA/CDA1 family)